MGVRHEDARKHDLLAAILAAKEQGIGAILAFAMAYLRGRYNGGAFTKQ
ncbi:phage holin family protein [Ottowia beijingensis]